MEPTLPPYLLPDRAAGNLWVRALVAGLGCWWRLRPLTSLCRLVPGCRAGVDLNPVRQRQLAGAATIATPTMRERRSPRLGRWIIGAWPRRQGALQARVPAPAERQREGYRQRHRTCVAPPSPPVSDPPAGPACGPRHGAAVERCASGRTRSWPRSHTGPAPGRTAA